MSVVQPQTPWSCDVLLLLSLMSSCSKQSNCSVSSAARASLGARPRGQSTNPLTSSRQIVNVCGMLRAQHVLALLCWGKVCLWLVYLYSAQNNQHCLMSVPYLGCDLATSLSGTGRCSANAPLTPSFPLGYFAGIFSRMLSCSTSPTSIAHSCTGSSFTAHSWYGICFG